MKTAVLEFQRNRVKRQQSAAASAEVLKTIVELRSALQCIGNAIEAVARLAVAQAGEGASSRRSVSQKKRASSARRKGKVVSLPHLPQILYPELGTRVRDNQPAA